MAGDLRQKPLSSVATIYERAGILCGGAGDPLKWICMARSLW